MCGIAGFIDFSKKSTQTQLKQMTDILHHRGPDDSGYLFSEAHNATIGLGHRRLSILDLTAHGHQPMQFEDISIVYNGEVYNFEEIKRELASFGYIFDSHSDTEVILKAYDKWGIDAVHKFNGMFAIAIWDRVKERCFLIRDRSGIKPLFWSLKDGVFLFASELKSLMIHPHFEKVIDHSALGLFLQYQYIPEPYSIFENCHKLLAGHYLEIDLKQQKQSLQQYWNVIDAYNRPKSTLSFDDAKKEMTTLLQSAFNYRMVSDVPVGVFLSGGYDSSVVTAILQSGMKERLKTFTIGFYENEFNEALHAKKVASYLGTDHHEYYCTHQDALDIIPKLCEIYDEPFADSSAIPTTLVSALARESVTVTLSADGGDEIFAGYERYARTQKYANYFGVLPNVVKKAFAGAARRIDPNTIWKINNTFNITTRHQKLLNMLDASGIEDFFQETASLMTKEEVKKLLNHPFENRISNFDHAHKLSCADDLATMLALDYKTYMMDDVLVKVDRATMSVSLEGREPLLDYRIIEFAASLPSAYKFHQGETKYLLKEIAHDFIPKEVLDRPKMGFGVPIETWFKDELKHYFLHYLDEKRLDAEGIFNAKEVVKLRDRYLIGEKEDIEKLWSILMFEMWYEKWM